MTRTETARLLALVQQMYRHKKSGSEAGAVMEIKLWHTVLVDTLFDDAKLALTEHYTSSPYIPTAHEIRDLATEIRQAIENPIFDIFHTMLLNYDFKNAAVLRNVWQAAVSYGRLSPGERRLYIDGEEVAE